MDFLKIFFYNFFYVVIMIAVFRIGECDHNYLEDKSLEKRLLFEVLYPD